MQVELRLDSKRFEAQIRLFEDRVGRGSSAAVMDAGKLKAGDRLLAFYRRRFYRSSGRNWAPLAPSTIASKRRRGTYGKGILRDTDQLFHSFVSGSPNNIRRIVSGVVQVGSADPLAKLHQRGTSRMPARPVLVPPDNETSRQMDEELAKAVDSLIRSIFGQAA